MFREWYLCTLVERDLEHFLHQKNHERKHLGLYKLFQNVRRLRVGKYSLENVELTYKRALQSHVHWKYQLGFSKLCKKIESRNEFTTVVNANRFEMENLYKTRAFAQLRSRLYRKHIDESNLKLITLFRTQRCVTRWWYGVKNSKKQSRHIDYTWKHYRCRMLRKALHNLWHWTDWKVKSRGVTRHWRGRHRRHVLRRALQHFDTLICAKWGGMQEKRLLKLVKKKRQLQRGLTHFKLVVQAAHEQKRKAINAAKKQDAIGDDHTDSDISSVYSYVPVLDVVDNYISESDSDSQRTYSDFSKYSNKENTRYINRRSHEYDHRVEHGGKSSRGDSVDSSVTEMTYHSDEIPIQTPHTYAKIQGDMMEMHVQTCPLYAHTNIVELERNPCTDIEDSPGNVDDISNHIPTDDVVRDLLVPSNASASHSNLPTVVESMEEGEEAK